ncbi:MAG: hypothetical protein U0W24_01030 [Bacteroidales bacterium]
MNKSVYFIGFAGILVTLLAVIFKILHWPGAGLLILAGIGSLALIYVPFAWFQIRKSTDDRQLKKVYFAAFLSFMVVFAGMIFKILEWPGAAIFLLIGIPLPFVFFLPTYIFYHVKRKLKTDLNFFAILLFMIYLAVFSSLLTLDSNQPVWFSYAHLTNDISKSNNYLSSALSNQSSLKSRALDLVNQLEQMKIKLINESGQENKFIIDGKIDYFEIDKKNYQISEDIMKQAGFEKFNTDFDKFAANYSIKASYNIENRLIDEINELRLPKNSNESPAISEFKLITVLNTMTDWQNKILLMGISEN